MGAWLQVRVLTTTRKEKNKTKQNLLIRGEKSPERGAKGFSGPWPDGGSFQGPSKGPAGGPVNKRHRHIAGFHRVKWRGGDLHAQGRREVFSAAPTVVEWEDRQEQLPPVCVCVCSFRALDDITPYILASVAPSGYSSSFFLAADFFLLVLQIFVLHGQSSRNWSVFFCVRFLFLSDETLLHVRRKVSITFRPQHEF